MAEEAGFLAVLLAIVAFAGVTAWRRNRRWRARVVTRAGTTRVGVGRGLRDWQELRAIALSAPDYDEQLADAQADATMKAAALNAAESFNRRQD